VYKITLYFWVQHIIDNMINLLRRSVKPSKPNLYVKYSTAQSRGGVYAEEQSLYKYFGSVEIIGNSIVFYDNMNALLDLESKEAHEKKIHGRIMDVFNLDSITLHFTTWPIKEK